ncbi:MAG: MazG nucleotide pyrophosphohydrolase domain-containing protein [Gemmatales bacterium]|nr:MoaD/ThiS family protein [Gemmatales bacterium]MCS7161374.1 MoaD/ThiS family protein [Gemmatales bacterium]MDW8176577.1 MazG nucleotide pyrophosphohydrolase domain-containing protein [Gemmatales bacterium]MDW8223785.1 MazG nucleotide pyrophosphohydrolase domain-containing protein [Gemmatales bacterium]
MQVLIKPMGMLRQRLGGSERILEVPEGTTLEQLLGQLGLARGAVQVVMVNGERESDLTRPLQDRDEITLLAPVAGGNSSESVVPLTLGEMQTIIRNLYGPKDDERGLQGCFLWFLEEVGELAAAIRRTDPREIAAELADVLAWLATLANVAHVDLGEVFYQKYGRRCPGCLQHPCVCPAEAKP